jgi:hypothetical protein
MQFGSPEIKQDSKALLLIGTQPYLGLLLMSLLQVITPILWLPLPSEIFLYLKPSMYD